MKIFSGGAFIRHMDVRSSVPISRLIKAAALICLAVVCYAVSVRLFGDICPFKRLTGIPCPGCGMTRAYIAALRGDFCAAFSYHPLFWTVPALVWLAAAYTVKPLKRREIMLFCLSAVYIIVYIVRLICTYPNFW